MKKKKQTKEKCLVSEARDKCQCSWCKQYREMRDFNLKYYVQMEINKVMMEALKEKDKIQKNKKGGK